MTDNLISFVKRYKCTIIRPTIIVFYITYKKSSELYGL